MKKTAAYIKINIHTYNDIHMIHMMMSYNTNNEFIKILFITTKILFVNNTLQYKLFETYSNRTTKFKSFKHWLSSLKFLLQKLLTRTVVFIFFDFLKIIKC